MPNHCSQVIKFDGDISKLNGFKVKLPNLDTLIAKSAIIYCITGDTAILEEEEYFKKYQDIDKQFLIAINGRKDVYSKIKSIMNKALMDKGSWYMPECFRGILEENSSTFDFELLEKETKMSEYDWFNTNIWLPTKMGYHINGFNSTFDGDQYGRDRSVVSILSKEHILVNPTGLTSLYNYYVENTGTKWGVYNLTFDDNDNSIIHHETAWNPLNENANDHFLNYIHKLTNCKPEFEYFSEAGCDFFGRFDFEIIDNEIHSEYIVEDDILSNYVSWDEDTCDMEISDDAPKEIRILERYGFGG